MTAPARVPVGWLIALGTMGLLAGLTLGLLRERLRIQAERSTPAAVPVDPVVDAGRAAYVQCQGCHQADGRGLAGFAPPLAGSAFATGDGLAGDGTWRSTMAAQRAHLSDAQIAAVLTYVRSSWGNHAPAVTENTVIVQRAKDTRGEPWTRTALANALEDDDGQVPQVMAGAVPPPPADTATGAAP
jgi:mono/diheme cytochrome c family protein